MDPLALLIAHGSAPYGPRLRGRVGLLAGRLAASGDSR